MLLLTCTEIIAFHISDTAMSVLSMQMPDLYDCNTMKRKFGREEENENFKTLVASIYLQWYVFLRYSMANILFLPFYVTVAALEMHFGQAITASKSYSLSHLFRFSGPETCCDASNASHLFTRSVIHLWSR